MPVNVWDLGVRVVKRRTVKPVPDPRRPDVSTIQEVVEEIEERQPILTPEEAQLIADADWKPTVGPLREYGNYMCVYQGRRFFTSKHPKYRKHMMERKRRSEWVLKGKKAKREKEAAGKPPEPEPQTEPSHDE